MTALVSDWRTFSTPHAIERAATERDHVALSWSDGRITRHNRFWLRDNCSCSRCFLALTREQLYEIVDAPADLAVAEARREAGGLRVVWSDGHASLYEPGWLRAHAGDAASRREREQARAKPLLWGRDYADRLSSFTHADIMADDGALLSWLTALRSTGLTLVTGVSAESEALLAPIARIGH